MGFTPAASLDSRVMKPIFNVKIKEYQWVIKNIYQVVLSQKMSFLDSVEGEMLHLEGVLGTSN